VHFRYNLAVLFISAFILFLAVFLPVNAFAWGPLTHVYLGSEIFFLGGAIPPSIYTLLKKYKQDYLYGNIMADVIFAKKYLPREKNPHNWDVALDVFDDSRTEAERAFAYGYLSHLAADTVAHGSLTRGKPNLRHSLMELRAERKINRHYMLLALSIDPKVQKRGDLLLKRCLESPFFSFKTNKRILKGTVLISGLAKPVHEAIFPDSGDYMLEELHEKSLERMLDVLEKGRSSKVMKRCPMGGSLGGYSRPQVMKNFLH
jgi:hypothetical protein